MRAIQSSISGLTSPFATRRFTPISLFAAGEPGVWFDPSDLTTLFQDSAGTMPVTAAGQPVGLMLDKSQQTVFAPRINLLTYTEQFDNAAWQKSAGGTGLAPVVTQNAALAPDGTMTADQVVFDAGASTTNANWSLLNQTATTEAVTYTGSVWLRTLTGTATIVTRNAAATTYGSVVVSTQWQRFSRTELGVAGTGDRLSLGIRQGLAGIGTINASATVLIWGAQLETGSTATTYQAVTTLPTSWLGNHATQSTAGQRPTYAIMPKTGIRNLLTYTEQFNNAVWAKGSVTVSANSTTAPDGTVTADTVTNTNGVSSAQVNQTVSLPAATHTVSFWVMGGTTSTVIFGVLSGSFLSGTAIKISGPGSISGTTLITLTGLSSTEWTRVSFTFTAVSGNNLFVVYPETTAAGTGKSVVLWGAQLELGSTATAYQKVVSKYDVTEVGVQSLSYLSFDGIDDGMVTPTITPGIDKVQVFAGVRKLSDAATAVVAEFSTGVFSNNGAFLLSAPRTAAANYGFSSRGTNAADATSDTTFATPLTNVLTGIGDIGGDNSVLRVNGTQAAQSTADQGTGNYLAYPLYIGRRGGTSLPFNGNLYGVVARFGPNLTDGKIIAIENWMNVKTGAY